MGDEQVHRVRQAVGYRAAVKRGLTGKEIGVAVLDSGVSWHPDFDTRLWGQKDFIGNRGDWYDDHSHGTHVAGIIAGSGKMSHGRFCGMAPGCRILPVKVLDKRGDGKVEVMLNALDWLKNHRKDYKIRLVNISVGALPEADTDEGSQLLEAVEDLWSCGLVVVVAAGNEGPGAGTITTPGISRKVITVGTCDDHLSLGKGSMVNYSGRGPTKSCIVKPEIIAPGQMVRSCSGYGKGYTVKSGTSMSAAVVTGALALLLEKESDLTNKEIKLRLYHRAKNLGWPVSRQGWGMLDMERLLQS